jgi:hypothetical protein
MADSTKVVTAMRTISPLGKAITVAVPGSPGSPPCAAPGVTIYNPAEGDYFVGSHDGEWWEQTFATTPGGAYTLTYSSAYGAVWWTNIGGYYRPGMLSGTVTLTGNALLLTAPLAGTSPAPTGNVLLDAPFVWSEYTLSFVADSTFTTLRFSGSTVLDGGFVFVDDVAVVAIPESPAVLLLLLGLPLVWLQRSRAAADQSHVFSIQIHSRASVNVAA